MVQLYGIKTCGSVKKAIAFLESKNIAYIFIDLKEQGIAQEDIESWLQDVSLDVLFNKKGTTYKKLGLKDLNLGQEEMKEWLIKEPMLIKRPVIVCDSKDSKVRVLVGFDAEMYAKVWA